MGDLHGFATFYRYGWVNRRDSSVNRHVCLGIPKGLGSHCFIESMMCIPVSIRDTPISIDANIYIYLELNIDYIIIHVMCISVCDMIYLFQCLCIFVLCRLLASCWHIQVGVGWQLPSPSKILGWAPWVSYGKKARDWTMQYTTGWWFGTWFLFFHILGNSSAQLTNSYSSER